MPCIPDRIEEEEEIDSVLESIRAAIADAEREEEMLR